eukprot:GHVH01016962.1.p1 GENE.GHVH01016962.1~~GHVH01016962.1.p1  ORF type:complete len:396 (+),score=46.98 GHVH01016962.1:1775-2962(+)
MRNTTLVSFQESIKYVKLSTTRVPLVEREIDRQRSLSSCASVTTINLHSETRVSDQSSVFSYRDAFTNDAMTSRLTTHLKVRIIRGSPHRLIIVLRGNVPLIAILNELFGLYLENRFQIIFGGVQRAMPYSIKAAIKLVHANPCGGIGLDQPLPGPPDCSFEEDNYLGPMQDYDEPQDDTKSTERRVASTSLSHCSPVQMLRGGLFYIVVPTSDSFKRTLSILRMWYGSSAADEIVFCTRIEMIRVGNSPSDCRVIPITRRSTNAKSNRELLKILVGQLEVNRHDKENKKLQRDDHVVIVVIDEEAEDSTDDIYRDFSNSLMNLVSSCKLSTDVTIVWDNDFRKHSQLFAKIQEDSTSSAETKHPKQPETKRFSIAPIIHKPLDGDAIWKAIFDE